MLHALPCHAQRLLVAIGSGIQILDAKSLQIIFQTHPFAELGNIAHAAVIIDHWCIIAKADALHLFSFPQLKLVQSVVAYSNGQSFAMTANVQTKKIFTGSEDGLVTVWNHIVSEREWKAHNADINCLAAVDDLVYTGSDDKTIACWTRFGELVKTYTQLQDRVSALHVTPSKVIAAGAVSGMVCIWDRASDACQCVSVGERNTLLFCALQLPDSAVILGFGGNDDSFDLQVLQQQENNVYTKTMQLPCHKYFCRDLQLVDEASFCSIGNDHILALWSNQAPYQILCQQELDQMPRSVLVHTIPSHFHCDLRQLVTLVDVQFL